jgi:hypothetical protein
MGLLQCIIQNVDVMRPKMVSLKVIHPLKISQHAIFHDPTLTGASTASTSKV